MMVKTIQGLLDAKGVRFAIIVSRFNTLINDRLLRGALDALERHGASMDETTVIWVPGSFEVPAVAGKLALSKKFDAVICLGTLIRGETPHFDHLSSAVTKALGNISISADIPVINGILTCNTMEQALDRAGAKTGNKGFEAAVTAIEMAHVLRQL